MREWPGFGNQKTATRHHRSADQESNRSESDECRTVSVWFSRCLTRRQGNAHTLTIAAVCVEILKLTLASDLLFGDLR